MPRLPEGQNPILYKFLQFSVIIYVLLTLLCCLFVFQFLDLIISLLLLSSVQLDVPFFYKSFAKKCMFGIGLSSVLSVTWLVFFTRPWWNTGYIDGYSLIHYRRAWIVLEWALLGIKLIVFLALVMNLNNTMAGDDEFLPEEQQPKSSRN